MNVLTIEQKEQVRKDLNTILQQKMKAENSPIAPQYLVDAITAQLRIFETLAIHAGVFDVVEVPASEVTQNG